MERLESISLRLAQLEAKEQIRDVLYRYCRAADRRDIELFKSCYHTDATDNHGFYQGSGHGFADYVFPALNQLDLCIHSLSNPLIEINGDLAYAQTQWTVIHRLRRWLKITDLCHNGRYIDTFERRDGQWKILHRVAILDAERWVHTADLQNFIPDAHPYKSNIGTSGKNDMSYQPSRTTHVMRLPGGLKNVWGGIRLALLLPVSWLHILDRLARASRIPVDNFYT